MSGTFTPAADPRLPGSFRVVSWDQSVLRRLLILTVAASSMGAVYGTAVRVALGQVRHAPLEVLVPAAVIAGVVISPFWAAPFFHRNAKYGHLLLTASVAGTLFPTVWLVVAAFAGGSPAITPIVPRSEQLLRMFYVTTACSVLGLAVAALLLPLFTASARLRDSSSIEDLVVTLRAASLTLLLTGAGSLVATACTEGVLSPSVWLVVASGLPFALSLRLSILRARWRGWLARSPSMLTRLEGSVDVLGVCVLDAHPTHLLLERSDSPYRRAPKIRLLVRIPVADDVRDVDVAHHAHHG